MKFSLRVITEPSFEPVTVDEVKMHARISHDVEDTLIGYWITSGRVLAENYQRRAYITQVLEYSLDVFPSQTFYLPRAPVQSVDSFKYYCENTETSWALDNLITDTDYEPARISLAYGINWPSVVLRDINAIKVRYTAGYGDSSTDVPQNVRDAIMLYCSWRDLNRTAEAGNIPRTFYDLLETDRLYQ
jgi:uncharacterized phiE125 gp8 family phage protein